MIDFKFNLQRFGDWFQTCGITNYPLLPDTRAVAIVLRQNITDLTTDHLDDSQSIFSLVTLPIKGSMNSYGKFDKIDDNPLVEKHLQKVFHNNSTLMDNYNNLIDCNIKGYAIEYIEEDIYVTVARYMNATKNYFDLSNKLKLVVELTNYCDLPKYIRFQYFIKNIAEYPSIAKELACIILVDEALLLSRRFWSPQIGLQYSDTNTINFISQLELE